MERKSIISENITAVNYDYALKLAVKYSNELSDDKLFELQKCASISAHTAQEFITLIPRANFDYYIDIVSKNAEYPKAYFSSILGEIEQTNYRINKIKELIFDSDLDEESFENGLNLIGLIYEKEEHRKDCINYLYSFSKSSHYFYFDRTGYIKQLLNIPEFDPDIIKKCIQIYADKYIFNIDKILIEKALS